MYQKTIFKTCENVFHTDIEQIDLERIELFATFWTEENSNLCIGAFFPIGASWRFLLTFLQTIRQGMSIP